MTVTESPLSEIQLTLVNSVEEAGRFMSWLGERRPILGVDTETGGFSPTRERLRLVQIGDGQHGWSIPWERWGGVAEEALGAYEGPIVMHNAPFDTRFLHLHMGWDIPWDRVHDTMTMAHLADPTRPKGLKPLAARLIDRRAVAGEGALKKAMSDHKWTWDSVPIDLPEYWVYAALDPLLTCRIYEKLSPTVLTTYREAYELEMGALAVCTRMMLKGVRIDPEYCTAKAAELRAWTRGARAYLRDGYDLRNATSNKQIAAALQRSGVELTKVTKEGDWAVDKEVLEPLIAERHPIAVYVDAIRKADKICGTYLEKLVRLMDPDGRVRAQIHPLGAITGRMSISDPSLQNLPRKDAIVRTGFVADPGNRLVTCDADQIEARLMAHFSGDPGMIEAFTSTEQEDFFCALASQIWGEPVEKGDPRRQLTKGVTYGKQYGAGIERMAITARVAYAQMEPVVRSFDARFPGVTDFMHAIERVAKERRETEGEPYIISPYGRRFIVTDKDKIYPLVNYYLQGHAAEVLKRGACDLDAAGLGEYLELPVHDEFVADVPAEDAEDVAKTMESVLTDRTGYRVPLTWSADVLEGAWGGKYE